MNEDCIFFVFCLQFLLANAFTIEHKETFLAREGDHVIMGVEHHDGKLRIEFRPNPYHLVKNFDGLKMQDGYNYTFNGSVGYFEIFKLTKSKADYYDFFFAQDNGEGIDYSINIIIADLRCGLNFPKYYIVDNDCQKVKKDKIDLWCRLVLSEPTNAVFPIEWKTGNGNRRIMNVTYTNETYSEAREVDVALNVGDTIETYASTIRYATTFSPQLKIHAKNKTSREFTSYRINPMTPDNKRPVTCQANVSQFVHCSYEWRHKDGNVVNKFQGNILHKEDLEANGTYECLASCVIKDNSAKQCVLLSDRFEFATMITDESKKIRVLNIVVVTLVLLVTSISTLFFYGKKMRKKYVTNTRKNSQRKNFSGILSRDKLQSKTDTFSSNKTDVLKFIKKIENNLQTDYATISDLNKTLLDISNVIHKTTTFQEHPDIFLKLFVEKLQDVENKLSIFCAESAYETNEKCSKSEISMQLIEILQDFKTLIEMLHKSLKLEKSLNGRHSKLFIEECEQSELFSKPDDKTIKNLLKTLKESNVETVLQNILDILGGPSTFSINLEKFLDLDDELLQMWNGLKYMQDHFVTLIIFKSEIEQKMKPIKNELSAIENSALSENWSEKIVLKSGKDDPWNVHSRSMDKYSNTVSLIDGVIRCFDGVPNNQKNFNKILKWSQDFKSLYESFEKVLDNGSDYSQFQNPFQLLNELRNTFLDFQKKFDQNSKAATLMHLQVEIETKLTNFHEEVQTTLANMEKSIVAYSSSHEEVFGIFGFLKSHEETIRTRRVSFRQLSLCVEKFQEYFDKPTIIQINIENYFDNEFKKLWRDFENILQDPLKLFLFRKEAEKNKAQLAQLLGNEILDQKASVLDLVDDGFRGRFVLKIDLDTFKKLNSKISIFQKTIGEFFDFEKYLKSLLSLRAYFLKFARQHRDYSSYDEDRQLKVYVELKKKKEALEQIVKDFEKDLRLNFIKVIEPKSSKIENLISPLKNFKNIVIHSNSKLQKVEDFRLLWGELTDLRSFLRTFQDGFVDLTSVFIIFEKCIEMDEDLLKFWEGLDKDFSNVSIYKALLALRSDIQKKKENLKRERSQETGTSRKKVDEIICGCDIGTLQKLLEERKRLTELLKNNVPELNVDALNREDPEVLHKESRKILLRDPLYFIDHLLKGFRPHQYVIVDSEALSTFHDRSLRFKTKLEDYEKCCDDIPNLKEFLEKLSLFIDEILVYKNKFVNEERNNKFDDIYDDSDNDLPIKKPTIEEYLRIKFKAKTKKYGLKSYHWKLEKKRKKLEKVFDAFKVNLENKSPKLNETNMENASYEQNSDDLKDLSADLSAFSTALKKFQSVIRGPTLLLIDLDKCLDFDEEMSQIWHDFVHSTYITKHNTIDIRLKLRERS